MFPHVRERLLGDAVADGPSLNRQLTGHGVLVEGEGDACRVGQSLEIVPERDPKASWLVEGGGMQLEQEMAKTCDRARNRFLELGQGLTWRLLFRDVLAKSAEAHADGRHPLDRVVVDLSCDAPTLPFLGRDQRGEQPSSLLTRLPQEVDAAAKLVLGLPCAR